MTLELYKGDALAVLRELPDASVDAVVTDPPYSSGGFMRGDRMQDTVSKYVQTGSKRSETIGQFTGDNKDQRAFGYWSALWLGECARVVKPGGFALVFTDWRQLPATTDYFQAGGFIWRGIVPWVKNQFRPVAGRYGAQCEYVVWGTNGARSLDYTAPVYPGWYEVATTRKRNHVTEKPVELMRQLLAPVGSGVILDPFMGSGTTGVAALMDGFGFVGIELTGHYFDIAERRIHGVRDGVEILPGTADQDMPRQGLMFADVEPAPAGPYHDGAA